LVVTVWTPGACDHLAPGDHDLLYLKLIKKIFQKGVDFSSGLCYNKAMKGKENPRQTRKGTKMKYDVWFVNWMGYELMGSFESEEAAQNWIDYES